MWVKVTTLSFQCMDKLNFTTMPENVPIMLALCLMPARPYYAPNYAGIIRPSLLSTGVWPRETNTTGLHQATSCATCGFIVPQKQKLSLMQQSFSVRSTFTEYE